MDRRTVLLTGLAAASPLPAFAAIEPRSPASMPTPPIARKEPKRIEQLGRVRVDDYAWMKDDNWQTVLRDPSALRADIRTHLEAENAYTTAMLAGTEPLQARLFAEMKGRIKDDDSSVPQPDGPWAYATRFVPGAEHPLHVRRPRVGGEEQVLLDVDAQAKGKAYYRVSAAEHSPDHTLYAYAADEQGSEVYSVFVRDLATGKDLPEPIENVAFGSFVWSPDGAFIFWVHRDDNGRPAKIYRRPARGGAADAVLVYDEPDPGMFLGVDVSESRQFILITIANQETSEIRIIPAQTPQAEPQVFAPRIVQQLYAPTHFDGRWWVLTNADGAVDFKVMTCPLDSTGREHWREALPHEPGRYIEGLLAFKDHLVRLERVNALPRIAVRDRSGQEHAITQSEAAYALSLDPGYEFDTQTLRFVYQSPSTPRQWIDYDLQKRTRTLLKTQDIPSGHDPAKYRVERLDAPAADGALVPITLLMRADTPRDGSAPMLLYGYGSYGNITEASFSVTRLSLVDRGFIWAIAHVRGGAERGRGWFEDGRKEKKINTFTDFTAAADHLIAQKYTKPRRIVAYGGSAGGLLVGAIANLRPELWGGVIGAVPFVDALNTISDASLPLTPPEWPEWGNPLEDAKAYDTILSYSPYDNVGAKPYPPILATGGLSDPRVTYWEPTKWVAKLREQAPEAGPYLLRMNMDAGHGGAAGRYDYLKELAIDFSFALRALGMEEAGRFPT